MKRNLAHIFLAIICCPGISFATNYTKANTATMNNSSDWIPTGNPGSFDNATFDSTLSSYTSVSFGSTYFNCNSLIFTNTMNNTVSIGSSSTTYTMSPKTIDASAANFDVTITCPISQTGSDLALLGNSTHPLTFTSWIYCPSTLNFNGNGIVTLSGYPTYTCGRMNINGGILRIGADNSLIWGFTSGNFVYNGAALDLNGKTATSSNLSLTINGTYSSSIGAVTNSSGTPCTYSKAITLGSNSSIGGSGDITISGAIGGAYALTKVGADTLTLSTTNSYSGATNVSGGTLKLGAAGALNGTSGIVINNSGTLDVAGNNSSKPITLNGGALTNSSGTAVTLSGAVTVNSDSSVGGSNGNITLSNSVSGAYGLTKVGSSNLYLTSDNSYASTTISAGNLYVGSGGTTGTLGTTGVSNSGNLYINRSNAYTLGGAISGSGTLNNTGTGTTTLSGDSSYTGATNVTAGIIKLGHTNALGNSSSVTVSNSAGLDLNGNSPSNSIALSINGTYSASVGALTNSNASASTYSGGVTLSSDSSIGGSGDIAISGAVGGAHNLTKVGVGSLTLSTTNSYSGATNVSGGTLKLGAVGALNGTSGVVVGSGGTLDVAGYSLSKPITLNGGTLANSSATAVTYNQVFTLQNASSIGDASGDITLNNTVSGNYPLTKIGSSTLTFSGSNANTNNALVTISDGTLALNKTDSTAAIVDGVSIDGGTLLWLANHQMAAASSITMSSGSCSLNGKNETVLAFSNSGGTFTTGAGHLTGTGASVTWSGGTNTVNADGIVEDTHIEITGGSNTVEGQGAGTTGGILKVDNGGTGLEMTGATLTLNSDPGTPGMLVLDGNVITNASVNSSSIVNGLTETNPGTIDLDGGTRTFTTASDLLVSAKITNGGLTKAGANTLTLTASNDYTGSTTISNGILQLGNNNTSGSLSPSSSIIDNSSLAFNRTDTVTQGTDFGTITSGTGGITQAGIGLLILNAANSYSGTTLISSGTLQVTNANTVGSGNLTNQAILDIGTTSLSVSGTYTQTDAILHLTANSASTYGNIITSAHDATFSGTNTVAVTVGGKLTEGTTLSIIHGGAGSIYGTPTVVSSKPRVGFIPSNVNGVLVLTVHLAPNNFIIYANNSNSRAVANTLDAIQNPSSDMSDVFEALNDSTPTQITYSLNSMYPTVDGALLQTALSSILKIDETVTSYLENGRSICTFSCANDSDVGIWMQGIGDYAHQSQRGYSQGYNSVFWGALGGFDVILNHHSLRMGLSSGYEKCNVYSKDYSGRTHIQSIPGIFYLNYENCKRPYYIDTVLTFVYDIYRGSRQVTAGPTITRTANAHYKGQRYSAYCEGGYSFLSDQFRVTPFAGANFIYMHIDHYTEKGAQALDLQVNAQNYNMFLTDVGAKFAYPIDFSWGCMMPDFHVIWIYEWLGSKETMTSRFVNDGSSFDTTGFHPAQSGYDIGCQFTFAAKNKLSIALNYDLFLKPDYNENTGSLKIRYDF